MAIRFCIQATITRLAVWGLIPAGLALRIIKRMERLQVAQHDDSPSPVKKSVAHMTAHERADEEGL